MSEVKLARREGPLIEPVPSRKTYKCGRWLILVLGLETAPGTAKGPMCAQDRPVVTNVAMGFPVHFPPADWNLLLRARPRAWVSRVAR